MHCVVVNFLIRKPPADVAAGAGGGRHLAVVRGVPALSDEDKGVLFVSVERPEARLAQRSDAVLKKVERIVAETKGGAPVRSRDTTSYWSKHVEFGADFRRPRRLEKTRSAGLRAAAITRAWNQKLRFPKHASSPSARHCLAMETVAGFTVQLQDRSGGSVDQPRRKCRIWPRRPNGRRTGRLTTTFQPTTPQLNIALDREARAVGVKVDSVFQTLQAYLSGLT